LVHNQGPHNGLTPCGLWQNREVLSVLKASPLDEETITKEAPSLDVDGRGLLEYVISCARDPNLPPLGAHLQIAGTSTNGVDYLPPWPGEMGLCGARSPFHWGEHGPDLGCQEIVTACVLARINLNQKRVVISVRGEPSSLFPLQDRVDVERSLREPRIHDVMSLRPCSLKGSDDCGFVPKYVGRCESGKPVTLKSGGAGAATRVCNGLYACTRETHTAYASFIQDGAPDADVTFDCPSAVTLGSEKYGYYSVLVRPRVPNDAAPDVMAPGYPAREEEVFTFREGAYYGNLFEESTRQRAPLGACPGTALAGDAFACYSDVWPDPDIYMTDRWCAKASCWENSPQPCLRAFDPKAQTQLTSTWASACQSQSSDSQPHYQMGRELPHVPPPNGPFYFRHVITVYLNQPCDLTQSGGPNCGGFIAPIP
jgi:hypothetical protein